MKTSYLVPQQIPEFIRSTYPAFVDFLQAYYEWLENYYAKDKYGEIVDIDKTTDQFAIYFRKQLDAYGITSGTNKLDTLKRIKELYTTKGSTTGIKFLFRLIFNTEANVIHPWDYVFKPSAGKWQQDISVLVDFGNIPSANVFNLAGDNVILVDSIERNFETPVYSVIKRSGSVYEVFIRRIIGSTDSFTRLTSISGIVTGTIVNTLTSIKVIEGGEGFEEGQIYPITNYGGSGAYIRVKRVGSQGQILSADLTGFGIGYQAPFYAFIDPIKETKYDNTSRINFDQTGTNVLNVTYDADESVKGNEQGIVVNHNYTIISTTLKSFTVDSTVIKSDSTEITVDKSVDDTVPGLPSLYMEDPTYVGSTLTNMSGSQQVLQSTKSASIKCSIGSLIVYPGQYQTSENILGDNLNIQDSFYHQAFSYVTQVTQSIDEYINILKNVMHPSGTKHFAMYNISKNLNVNLNISPSLNFIAKEIQIFDTVHGSDSIAFDFTKVLTDSVQIQDEFVRDSYLPFYNTAYVENTVYNETTAILATTSWNVTTNYLETTVYDETTAVDTNIIATTNWNVTTDWNVTTSYLETTVYDEISNVTTSILVQDNYVAVNYVDVNYFASDEDVEETTAVTTDWNVNTEYDETTVYNETTVYDETTSIGESSAVTTNWNVNTQYNETTVYDETTYIEAITNMDATTVMDHWLPN